MKKLYLIGLIGVMASCKNSSKTNDIYYNSVDIVRSLNNDVAGNLIRFDDAHSGKYVYKISKENSFSGTFDIKVNDLPEKPKKVTLEAWLYLETLNSNPDVVIEIRDGSFNMKEWLSSKAIDQITQEKKWTKVTCVVDLTQQNRLNPDNRIRGYVSNGSEGVTYVDDLTMIFE